MTVDRADREGAILARLSGEGALTVSALATDLGVSEVTIRGDLRALEEQGMLVRTRGGARPTTLKSILQREKLNVELKQRIATAAAAMVRDDDNVMIEAGTTTALVARLLAGRAGVQIVTNSALVFNNARINPSVSVILTGGVFRRESESFVGPLAERAVGDFNARLAFLGTDGFSPERGLTTRFVEGGQVAALMRGRAEETWLLADSTKFGQAGFVSFLPLAGITGVITDDGLPPGAVESLEEHTRVLVV
ncbi:DeoR/GlpR family DNA-binding transcription regulator [Tessaracoccus flavus]|uniref:DeoR family transcriptional regulator n=1 Tax=Tessaracoccus flavus TaxID=1610493 RepID=A0A1Q2CH11_9ACTN|nr:DeoR/GlpR family DNA-binding transcription regulator [Tessaracoccus flavus]AQP45335.1 DeoR family transcriptional regulator [Tessaracoccus flavus]SDY48411.1 transcriptional regulator, DeoR family [Tessaracoccus flavus]